MTRDVAMVIAAVEAIMSARGVDTAALSSLHRSACYAPPENHPRIWLELCRWLGAQDLPDPTLADAPPWARWLSALVEGRVLVVHPAPLRGIQVVQP